MAAPVDSMNDEVKHLPLLMNKKLLVSVSYTYTHIAILWMSWKIRVKTKLASIAKMRIYPSQLSLHLKLVRRKVCIC